ncbi:hypothetical protein ABZ605_28330 [Streptomyces sp. NPDC012765]|uniref:hypothetical protein n=1 Tax=Streptomyces sp. NPDC012765 TaxID=3155249 RepID=UPI003402AD96
MKVNGNPDFTHTHVCLEGIDATFPARVPDWTYRGHALPLFDLETIRRIAEVTQEPLKKGDFNAANAIHVLDGGKNDDGSPRVIVARIDWPYVDTEGLDAATDLIEPTEDGLYDLGGLEWAWHVTADAPRP